MAKPEKYWWFEGDSVAELQRRLISTPGARLEVRIDRDDKMTLRVVDIAAKAPLSEDDINYSHVCPPACN